MPSKNGHGPKRAILYARVSTEEQMNGYSIPDQLRELRAYAAREGYVVVEEAVDDGHSGADPHRPGLRRVMELAESGTIDVVLAKKRNRLFRSRLYRLLWDQGLGELGVKLIALDDTGNRFGDAMQDEFAEWEREEIARRMQDRLLEKCRSGLIIKRKRAAYGYRASEDGNALEVSEPEMEVVRRIFRSAAEGVSVRSVRISLERDGIPAPSGIGRWNHTTIRNIIGSEVYAPHTYEEVAMLVESGVAALGQRGRLRTLDVEHAQDHATQGLGRGGRRVQVPLRLRAAPPGRMGLRAGARRQRVAGGRGGGEEEP
jgi:site-specific DNA recombinase